MADCDFVFAAVSKGGCGLSPAAEGLKADREIVSAAVSNDGNALESAAQGLSEDRECCFPKRSSFGR